MDQNTSWLYRLQDKGAARRMWGNVMIELVYVSDKGTFWTHRESDRFYDIYKNALGLLQKQAVAAGVPLSFTTTVKQLSFSGNVDANCTVNNTVGQISQRYLQRQGYAGRELEYVRDCKRQNGVDEMVVLFAMERGFRAAAHAGGNLEFCAVCQDDNEHAIAHELLHLFGAVDLYYPYHVYGQTMAYFPNTIMCTLEGMEVDPLTQYLIGWKNTPSTKAREFMSKVQDCTLERYRQANILEVYRRHEEILLRATQPYPDLAAVRAAASREDPWGEFLLGLCYRDGIGMKQDLAQAEKYFARSGKTGLTIAAAAHAQLLLHRGIRTEQDREDLWLLLIYNSWDHLKLNSLNIACQLVGVGCRKNPDGVINGAVDQYQNSDRYGQYASRSARLYEIAEKHCCRIPELYGVVSKLRRDYDRMLEQGDPDLVYVIARTVEEGRYVQRDLSDAFILYQQSAQGGNELACRDLARCYREGIGTARDLTAARKWELHSINCRNSNPWEAFCHVLRSRW